MWSTLDDKGVSRRMQSMVNLRCNMLLMSLTKLESVTWVAMDAEVENAGVAPLADVKITFVIGRFDECG